MTDISIIDPNFNVETNLKEKDIRFYDVRQSPFKIYGLMYEENCFRRMPKKVAQTVNPGVYSCHGATAGGRLRFKTDSPYVALQAKMPSMGKLPHFALTGAAGFDLYVYDEVEKYVSTFVPPYNSIDGFENIVYFGSSKMREITINFPMFSHIRELYVGVANDALIGEGRPYKNEKPVVYYGSSITQGGCVSRPGIAYQNIVSRTLNIDFINLGFSGSALAEPEIVEYIKNLDMSVFVCDYDHNAPTLEHLINTHERMYQTIRKANPNLPIVLMSRPKYYLTEDEMKRLEIIKTTYENAKANGDNNIYFIDGRTLMELAKDDGTVDGCHPNDFGFASMAKVVEKVLKDLL